MLNEDVLETKENILNKKEELRYEMKKLNKDLISLQKKCNHDLVFKFDDHELHKVGPIYTCICPICEKKQELYMDKTINKTCFKKSRVVDLTALDNFYGDYSKYVVDEVLSNIDIFYNEERPVEEIQKYFIDKFSNSYTKKKEEKSLLKKLKIKD